MNVLRVTADPGLHRLEGGRLLLGGSPFRVLRLSEAGARLLDDWLAGKPVDGQPAHRRLAARLVHAGVVHPVHDTCRFTARDVTVVVPVRDHEDALARLLPALDGVAEVVVVDDGSARPLPGATVRHAVSAGPAAARNTGWRRAGTELVAFLDADVVPDGDWLVPLLRHFEDPDVAAVAPRVLSTPGPSLLERYEQVRSPLDLGDAATPVRPGGRVAYVPSAALVIRASALRAFDGFYEDMRFGEDVDLVWRLAAAGSLVRYEPASTVRHTPRANWRAWARQRFAYGTSAAPLALRHGRAVTPLKVSVWSAVSWAAPAVGRPLTGAAVAGVTAALLPRRLRPVGVPAAESLRLALRGHLGAGRLIADAVTRSWWPVAVPALAAGRRGRWLLAAAYGQHALEWHRRRPPVDPLRWTALRALDDLCYGSGVWWGAVRHRTLAPLLPDLADWPGRDGVRDERGPDARETPAEGTRDEDGRAR
ncbi:mycofactocin biosynthesis glycosyltransferase MftF [Streptomyces sp. NPDC008313]|uniref:mycofactocin biosynthesis glycosyltransferase MftF n=1 Tax=Streptomyces sp. NPDC008313 TaxID=3364826 RepID=UPI0036EF11B4